MSEKGKRSGSARILTRENVKLLVKLYTEDLYDLKKLKTLFDCSSSTITNYLVREGIKVRTRTETQNLTKYSDKSVKCYYSDYLKGNSLAALCLKYKVHPLKLKERFNSLSLKTFTRTEWNTRFGIPCSGDNHPMRKKKLAKLEKLFSGTVSLGPGYRRWIIDYITGVIVRNYRPHIKVTDKVKRTGEYQLDHKYSVHDLTYNPKGLKTPATIQEICHPCNLCFKSPRSNMKKNFRSNISITTLRKRIRKFNRLYGDPYKTKLFLTTNSKTFEVLHYQHIKPLNWRKKIAKGK